MDFGQALDTLKNNGRVARLGWNGKGMFIYLVPGSTFEVNRPPLLGIYKEGAVINYLPHIDMRTADGSCVPWLASQTDILADDWAIVDLRSSVRLLGVNGVGLTSNLTALDVDHTREVQSPPRGRGSTTSRVWLNSKSSRSSRRQVEPNADLSNDAGTLNPDKSFRWTDQIAARRLRDPHYARVRLTPLRKSHAKFWSVHLKSLSEA